MLGRKERDQLELFITGSLRQLIPDDHVLVRVDRVLDLSWLRQEVYELPHHLARPRRLDNRSAIIQHGRSRSASARMTV